MSHSYDHGGNIFSVARSLGLTPDAISDFSASINPLGLSPVVKSALIGALDTLVHYPENCHDELKQALAGYHSLSPANFAIANGSTEIIYNLPTMLSGKKALIISPSFSEYARALTLHHWDSEHFILSPSSNFSIDISELERSLSSGIDLLYLCNPGNPSGTLYPQPLIEKIYYLCRAFGVFMVLDEAFMDFCEDGSAKHFIAGAENAIVLRSMTKFFGIPGLRLGYSISNSLLADRLDSIGGPWNVNTLALVSGVAALLDSQHNRRTLEFLDLERSTLLESIQQFPQFRVYPSSANFLLIEIINGMSAGELKGRLMDYRLLIRECSSFIGLSDRFFRIAVRSGEENRRLLECLGKILN